MLRPPPMLPCAPMQACSHDCCVFSAAHGNTASLLRAHAHDRRTPPSPVQSCTTGASVTGRRATRPAADMRADECTTANTHCFHATLRSFGLQFPALPSIWLRCKACLSHWRVQCRLASCVADCAVASALRIDLQPAELDPIQHARGTTSRPAGTQAWDKRAHCICCSMHGARFHTGRPLCFLPGLAPAAFASTGAVSPASSTAACSQNLMAAILAATAHASPGAVCGPVAASLLVRATRSSTAAHMLFTSGWACRNNSSVQVHAGSFSHS